MKFKDFIQLEIRDNIAVCWIDNKVEKMNVVSPAAIPIFDTLVSKVQEDDNILAVVLISRKRDFMGGADIKSFQIQKEGDFRPFQVQGHQTMQRIIASKKPFLAAIHGTCVGLGTELALACHARIATKSARTKMGLPEVRLGILPGAGGTQRLPRLIGIQKALDMMLTGKQINATRAKKWGLIDELTDEGKLLQAAIMMVKKIMNKPIVRKLTLAFQEKLLESSLFRKMLFSQAKKMALQRSQGNYPAIPAIIECVETGYKKGIKAGLEKELYWFEKLMLTSESLGLRSLFFAVSDNKKNPYKNAKPLNTLGMIGTGFMGAGIAEVSVMNDVKVLLKDIRQKVLDNAYQLIWKSIAKKLKYKSMTKIQAEQKMGSVSGQITYQHFDTADIVIEAILEEMPLKKRIIEEIEKHGNEQVIIATNTSSLSVTEMAKHARKPEMVIGMHYFSPVPKMPLLEIVITEHTAEWVVASCYELGLRQGKTVVVVKDGTGFYVNRILAPYSNECLNMVDEGIAIDAIDNALVRKGFPVGPIALADEVGLDIAAHVSKSTKSFVESKPGLVVNEALVHMYADGRKGRKNKKGFYLYNDKGKKQGVDQSAYQYFKGNGKKQLPMAEIQDRALMLMLNEAALCLEEGTISSPKDGDVAAVFGIGFLPFTGGPFRAMDSMSITEVVKRMNRLKKQYGEHFTPADSLVKMAETEASFYSD